MKILALDVGDAWIGSALSDSLHLIATPYQTIAAHMLMTHLPKWIDEHTIDTVVIGLPTTLRGTESTQTKKTRAFKEMLAAAFPTLTWVLWDERLTSQQAEKLKKIKSKEDKLRSHSIAAAFILQSYLDHRQFLKQ